MRNALSYEKLFSALMIALLAFFAGAQASASVSKHHPKTHVKKLQAHYRHNGHFESHKHFQKVVVMKPEHLKASKGDRVAYKFEKMQRVASYKHSHRKI